MLGEKKNLKNKNYKTWRKFDEDGEDGSRPGRPRASLGAVGQDAASLGPRARQSCGTWCEASSHCVSVGAVPVLSKEATSGERGRRFSPVKTPHNPLDSSAPLVKKGKQREVPKAKKPTSLKKVRGVSGQAKH